MIGDSQLDAALQSFHRDPATHRDLEAVVGRVLRTPIEEAPQSRDLLPQPPKWRYQSMFGVTKLFAAGAIVALFGGLLASQALLPHAPTVVVPGADTPMAAIDAMPLQENEFAGRLTIRSSRPPDAPGVIRYGYATDGMSDPRFEGTWTLDYTQVAVDFGDTSKLLYHAAFRMENDEGAWQEEPNLTLELPDGTATSRTSALVGEGAYDGLTAVTELTYIPQGKFDIHGVITDRPIPVAPDQMGTDQ